MAVLGWHQHCGRPRHLSSRGTRTTATAASLQRPETPIPAADRAWDYVRVRSFIAIVSTTARELRFPARRTDEPLHLVAGAGGRIALGFLPDATCSLDAGLGCRSSVTLVLGDDAEWPDAREGRCMGNAISVRVSLTLGTVRAYSSITGLPALFLCRLPDKVVLTSDFGLLADALESLQFDPAAVVDLFHIGYPTGHRTLLRDISLVPGGHAVGVGSDGRVTSARSWKLPEAAVRPSWGSFREHQVRTFRTVIRSMDLSQSFLSLTGGVGTRAILAALVSEDIRLPAATLCGPELSLDARFAQALGRAYGFPHHVVRLGTGFLRELPTYVMEAARLSGGGASLEEAGEIYFYRQLAGLGTRRLSGHLGNQVARQGFERVSLRRADLSVLSSDLVEHGGTRRERRRTFLPGAERWHNAYQRLVQEATHAGLANFRIGQHFATQLSPYTSRAMIESLGRSPMGMEPVGGFTASRARLRDLRHRFLGEPRAQSFQRDLITRVGGYAASCPLDWGWLANGGASPRGLALGALACADVVASWPNSLSRGLRAVLRATGAEGVHEIKPFRAWLTDWLKDFVHDTLRSRATVDSGLFDVSALERALRDHYVLGRCRYPTIAAALDVALAHQVLRAP